MSEVGKRVFLTGASGFICTHIVKILVDVSSFFPATVSDHLPRHVNSIQKGYQIVATVRSPPKAEAIFALHPDWKGKVDFVYVPDIAAPGAFDEVIKADKIGFHYIIHTASPVSFAVKDVKKDLIDPAVRGTTELMKAVHEYGGPQIKRFILLGSAVAILDSNQDITVAGKDYTEDDWNPVTVEEAVKTQSPVLGYNVGKKLAEKAAWEFLATEKPVFDLTVINPDIIIGPMLQPVDGPKHVNETNNFACYNFFNGTYKDITKLTFPFYHFVDVREVALAHVLSLTASKASNQRIILVSGLITPQLVANLIRKNFPQLHDRVDEGNPPQVLPKDVQPTGWNASKSHEIFGGEWEYKGLEESLVGTVKNILEWEKKWGI
ncbi:putative oxidoreductase [Hyphodiscus hymeniophilus]|uniref:Oxidoreductase n=1 Tax=Hyphodiscus hymeniophilus TaxID=353542 RepID=A0A9P6VQE1_9HELO|nr:putative oxidoreductase [Hyphodiscus hymeniophilus]